MKKNRLYIVIGVVVVVLLLLILSFTQDVFRMRRSGVFINLGAHRYSTRMHRTFTNVSDVGFLGQWMTFSYINKSFGMPPEVLQTQLSITDTEYPNMTISKAAGEKDAVESAYLDTVKVAVRAYLMTRTASSTEVLP